MKAKQVFFGLLSVFFFLALSALISLNGYYPVKAQSTTSGNYKLLLDEAKAKGMVRIIARLNMDFTPENYKSGKLAADQVKRIRSQQEQVLSKLSKENIENVRKYRNVPYFAAQISAKALELLSRDPNIKNITKDRLLRPSLTESASIINADEAWTSGYTGAGWTIAILDTGVNTTHSFFADNKIVDEACYSTSSDTSTTLCPNGEESQEGPGSAVDCNSSIKGCGHGTHVAGIAAGKTQSFSGVAKDANIIAIQVFSRFSDWDSCYPTAPPCVLSWGSDMVAGLDRILSLQQTYKIAAVNLSSSSALYFDNSEDVFLDYCDSGGALESEIAALYAVNIPTIIATGNEGYPRGIKWPACISKAISVASTDKFNAWAKSNYSPHILSLFAPGTSIYSSTSDGGFGNKTGSSLAAPHVAGAWALMRQKYPSTSISKIFRAFWNTGFMVSLWNGEMTMPRIDVSAALKHGPISPTPPYALSAKAVSTTSIDLFWVDASSNENGFSIERKTWYGIFHKVGTQAANKTTFRDTGLHKGYLYTYRIQSLKTGAYTFYSEHSNVASAITKKNPPNPPSNLRSLAISPSAVKLIWKDNSYNESGFRLQIKKGTCSSGYRWVNKALINKNIKAFTAKALSANTIYSYRIAAANIDGTSQYSNCSFAKTGPKGTPIAPDALTARASNASGITLTWNADTSNETLFRIYRKKNSSKFIAYGKIKANTEVFRDSYAFDNNANASFSYYVVACNTNGCSPKTAVATVPIGPGQIMVYPSSSQFEITWIDKSANENGLRIERKFGPCASGNPWRLVDITDPNTTYYSDINVEDYVAYSYRIRAFNFSNAPFAFGYSMSTPCRSGITLN